MTVPVHALPPAARQRRRRLAAVVLVLLLTAGSVLTARLFVWPDLPAVPEHADAVVALGGPGNRRALAIELVAEGRAPVLAISLDSDQLETEWCGDGRLHDVPVICFHPDPFTTRGEARAIAELAMRHGWHSVILVTSTDQAWRALVRVERCFDGGVSVATVPLPRRLWPRQVVYQWGATAKAFSYEVGC